MKKERPTLDSYVWLTACFFAAGAIFALCGCCLTPHEAKQAEDAIHWFSGFLPAPLGGIANSFAPVVATLLTVHGTKHVARHVAKRRAAKATP